MKVWEIAISSSQSFPIAWVEFTPERTEVTASRTMARELPFQYPIGRTLPVSSIALGSVVRFPSESYPPGYGSCPSASLAS